jgi:hypothetical protein
VGLGMAHPLIALDYVSRGLRLKRMSVDVSFTALLVFRSGIPLSDNAKELLRIMRIQMETDFKELNRLLNNSENSAA